MAKGKITWKQFVTKFNNSGDKQVELLQSHVVNNYVDYATKLTEINKIIEVCNHVDIPNPTDEGSTMRVFRRNTPSMYYLLKLRLISNYTDIEIKDDENLEAYDALESIGALDKLIATIPEIEITKWNSMLDMCMDDLYANERDLVSYLETKVDSLGMVLNTMLSGLGEVADKLGTINEDN